MPRLSPDEILVFDRLKGKIENSSTLLQALLASSVKEECEVCKLSEWNNKKIKLKVGHRDGNVLDNRKINLRLLCPNCFSQQSKCYRYPKDASYLDKVRHDIMRQEDKKVFRALNKFAKEDKQSNNKKI